LYIKANFIKSAILFLIIIIISGCDNQYKNLDLSAYQYRDTKDLVKFVYDASLILEKDGLNSLDYFKANRKKYLTKNRYLYIYDMTGTNLFHAGMEQIEGKNLIDITDKDGKKITRLVLQAIQNENNPHSWVHYSWWQPGKFYPVPESSCHFKVTTQNGSVLFVGGGLNYPQEEKEFIRIIVDDAAQLIEDKGEIALKEISNPVSKYNFRDIRVFAFSDNGETLISPVMNSTLLEINLLECIDEAGHKPFIQALKKLKTEDSGWEVFLSKNRYERNLRKMSLYLRKVNLPNKTIYVGAVTELPQTP